MAVCRDRRDQKDGPLVQDISNELLVPTAFSAAK
jgi:hypothetical protein